MKIDLLGGNTDARNVLESAQRRLNMYSELTDPSAGEPGKMTFYPTPGSRRLGTTPNGMPIRGLYRASNGDLYCVAGVDLYYIDPNWVFHLSGSLFNVQTVTSVIPVSPLPANVLLTTDGTVTGPKVTAYPSIANAVVGHAILVYDGVIQTNAFGWSISGANAVDFVIGTTGILSTASSISGGSVETVEISAQVPPLTNTITEVIPIGLDPDKPLNPIKMADNGVSLIICDGLPRNGWSLNLASRSQLKHLYDPGAGDLLTKSSTGWLGSTWVDYTDTYLIGNFIGTPTFYISNSEDIIFDPLQFAAKTSSPDSLVGAIVQHRVIWLIGETSSEVWYNTGGAATAASTVGGSLGGSSFPFVLMPGVSLDIGCAAPYSIAKAETSVFWLAQTRYGDLRVVRAAGYTAQRISTFAIEQKLKSYSTVSDCLAYAYMQAGHTFYVMNFPSADVTWVYEVGINQWHERCYTDDDGNDHMLRGTMHAFAYGTQVVNDWTSGNIYSLDLDVFNDAGQPIKRMVGLPRQIDNKDNNRIIFRSFTAEVSTGETLNPVESPFFSLQWSDDKGKTYSNGILQTIGKTGDYANLVQWNRLGLSRNRVFRIEWTADAMVALQGAFVEVTPGLS